MRAYFFGNYYLSSIQQGIQALHCIVEMGHKYKFLSIPQTKMLDTWGVIHKTVVLLNGGNQQSLIDLLAFFVGQDNPYPFGSFREDEQSLNEALTCVGIILPEKIYEGSALLRDRRTMIQHLEPTDLFDNHNKVLVPVGDNSCPHVYTEWEITLMQKLNEYRLA